MDSHAALPPAAAGAPADEGPVTVDRRTGPYGEVALRRRGGLFEIIANGCFLMDTSDGRSERLLVSAARDALGGREQAPSVLIGGLGAGFSLAEAVHGGAAASPGWGRVVVVEREQAVIDWHRAPDGRPGPLAPFSEHALDDPRVELVHADLLAYAGADSGTRATGASAGADASGDGERFDAICLDIDNGPDWTVTDDNTGLYSPSGLIALRNRLTPGGVLAVWSAQESAPFEERLRAHFTGVTTLRIPVRRGAPDVVHVARGTD